MSRTLLLSWIRCGGYANASLEMSSNGKLDFYVQANFEETLFEIKKKIL